MTPSPASAASAGVAPRRGRPPRTEAQRAAQRTRLVEAAMDAVRTLGPELSIDEMAAAAGVSKPVLYGEFGGKLGVADAIAELLAERLERGVIATLAAGEAFDVDTIITAVVEALVSLIDKEPELYAFLARSIRTSDRGFLDNPLVRVVRERAALIVSLVAPGMPKDHIAFLTDGLFGFVFGAVESWQTTKKPKQAVLVRIVSTVIRDGFRSAAAEL